jgi:hypothetical protein
MDWIVASSTPDGDLLLAYVPDAHAGAFTVDMTALSANPRARWYDPSSGSFTAIGDLTNSGSQSFTPPSANATGAHDWVLVLDLAPSSSPPATDGGSPPPATDGGDGTASPPPATGLIRKSSGCSGCSSAVSSAGLILALLTGFALLRRRRGSAQRRG